IWTKGNGYLWSRLGLAAGFEARLADEKMKEPRKVALDENTHLPVEGNHRFPLTLYDRFRDLAGGLWRLHTNPVGHFVFRLIAPVSFVVDLANLGIHKTRSDVSDRNPLWGKLGVKRITQGSYRKLTHAVRRTPGKTNITIHTTYDRKTSFRSF